MAHASEQLARADSAPSTCYVDWADLESKLTTRSARAISSAPPQPRARKRVRKITTVDAETADVRANVRDTAKAVLTWFAAVTSHDADTPLNDIVDQCLRPGPDVENVNYAAMARLISAQSGVDVSAKRVRTAIAHLRRAQRQKGNTMQRDSVAGRVDTLHRTLERNYNVLIEGESDQRAALRRSTAMEVLTAVRCAAGRVIDNDFGEGIPGELDLDQLEGRFLDFVRDLVRDRPASDKGSLVNDLHRLLVSLGDYDASCEADMRIVVDGARVTTDMTGPESLPGVMAQLNVLVAGRHVLDGELFCAEMLRLADVAESLHGSDDTQTFMNWVRRLPEDQRTPSPRRVRSYCLNNAATRIIEQAFRGELDDPQPWFDKAAHCLDAMRNADSGFTLIPVTEVLLMTAEAKQSGDSVAVRNHFAAMGRDATLKLLQDVVRFDDCVELVRAVQHHAIEAWPALKHQLLPVT